MGGGGGRQVGVGSRGAEEESLHHHAWLCCASVWETVCRWTALHLSYVNACVFISSPSSTSSSSPSTSSPPLFLNLFNPSQPPSASPNHLLLFNFCFFATTSPPQNKFLATHSLTPSPPPPPSSAPIPHLLSQHILLAYSLSLCLSRGLCDESASG